MRERAERTDVLAQALWQRPCEQSLDERSG